MIDFDTITFSNNYMFNTVMSRKELCRKCLERILDIKISEITIPDSEKWIGPDIDAKSIRLDIYCEDAGKTSMYNIELQNELETNLPRRSRYYQDLMDIDALDKGQDYSKLANSIVIFICTFDPYKKNRHLYTFENRCIQDNSLGLDDGTKKIFLNTKGTIDDVPKPLKLFLDYINTGIATDDFTKQLDDAVIEIRQDSRWRKRIMTLEQYAKEQADKKVDKINKLVVKLIEAGRVDELKESAENKELQNRLLKEFGLIED